MVQLGTASLVLCVAVASLNSCRPAPVLKVRADQPLSYRQLAANAPIVVVGKALAVEMIGRDVRTADEHRYPLRLQRGTVQVENVLKGALNQGVIEFYRYGWSPDHAMVGPWGMTNPGHRSVFFLDTENGTLRSVVDLYHSEIWVCSGRHTGFKLSPGQTLAHGIASLLLTPGEDVQPEAFGRCLSAASGFSMEVAGRSATLRLLKALSVAKEPFLREQACIVLADRFYGQARCLIDLAANRGVSQQTRLLVEKGHQQELRRDSEFRRQFLKHPLDWAMHEAGSSKGEEVLDVLQVMAQHSDAVIRRKACALIAQEFPASYSADCGQ